MAIPQPREIKSVHDHFMMILPEMNRLLRWCFRHEDTDTREELTQEALCRCWAMYLPAYQRGKRLGAHGLAWYGWISVRSGRRFCGESKRSVRDWVSINSVAPDELLAADWHGRWPVADAASFRTDWAGFLDRQTDMDAKTIGLLAIGCKRSEAARLLAVSPAWVTQHMARLHKGWLAFVGAERTDQSTFGQVVGASGKARIPVKRGCSSSFDVPVVERS
jgi:hypothetical protein